MTNSTIGNRVINGLMKHSDSTNKNLCKHIAWTLGIMLVLLAGFNPAAMAQNHGNKPVSGTTGTVANHSSNTGPMVQRTKTLSANGRQVQLTVSG